MTRRTLFALALCALALPFLPRETVLAKHIRWAREHNRRLTGLRAESERLLAELESADFKPEPLPQRTPEEEIREQLRSIDRTREANWELWRAVEAP